MNNNTGRTDALGNPHSWEKPNDLSTAPHEELLEYIEELEWRLATLNSPGVVYWDKYKEALKIDHNNSPPNFHWLYLALCAELREGDTVRKELQLAKEAVELEKGDLEEHLLRTRNEMQFREDNWGYRR